MNKNANVNMIDVDTSHGVHVSHSKQYVSRKQTSLTFETLYIFEFVILIDHSTYYHCFNVSVLTKQLN